MKRYTLVSSGSVWALPALEFKLQFQARSEIWGRGRRKMYRLAGFGSKRSTPEIRLDPICFVLDLDQVKLIQFLFFGFWSSRVDPIFFVADWIWIKSSWSNFYFSDFSQVARYFSLYSNSVLFCWLVSGRPVAPLRFINFRAHKTQPRAANKHFPFPSHTPKYQNRKWKQHLRNQLMIKDTFRCAEKNF